RPSVSVTAVAGLTEPPAGAVKVTGTPTTGPLSTAMTRTTSGWGSVAPTWLLWLPPDTICTALGVGDTVMRVESHTPVGVCAVTHTTPRAAPAAKVPLALMEWTVLPERQPT